MAKLSFQKVKEALFSAPVLAQTNFNREFLIQCDALKVRVGGVLFHYDDNENEHAIALFLKSLTSLRETIWLPSFNIWPQSLMLTAADQI